MKRIFLDGANWESGRGETEEFMRALAAMEFHRNVVFSHSPLQTAIANRFFSSTQHFRIGHRGERGCAQFSEYVLDNPNFFRAFKRIIERGSGGISIYLPHSLNGIYLLSYCNDAIKEIFYIDEGDLTHSAIALMKSKCPKTPDLRTRIFRRLLGSNPFIEYGTEYFYKRFYKEAGVKKLQSGDFSEAILTGKKFSGVITHRLSFCRFDSYPIFGVDISNAIAPLPRDLDGIVCVFLNKNELEGERFQSLLMKLRAVCASEGELIGFRFHPGVSQGDKMRFLERAKGLGLDVGEIGRISEEEIVFELYARGVRRFLVGGSSVLENISAYPDYFESLKLDQF
jgi:hypothetical protein